MVPGVVCWGNLASGPCSPGRVISAGESRSERLWWLGVSRGLPGPKGFLHRSFLKLLLQHTQSFRQQVDSWAMVTGQVLTCKGGQQASHHDVQAELPKRLSVLGELPPKLWQMEGGERSPNCCWLLSHILSPCPEAGGEMCLCSGGACGFWKSCRAHNACCLPWEKAILHPQDPAGPCARRGSLLLVAHEHSWQQAIWGKSKLS